MKSKNPFTSSERRGILIVAAIALIITLFGLINFGESDAESIPELSEIEIIKPDSLENLKSESEKNKEKKKKSNSKKTSTDKKKKSAKSGESNKKIYPQRSPLDEEVTK